MVLTESDYSKLKHWDNAPNFELIATDNNNYSFDSFKEARAFLIVFICNHCPYVKAKFGTINEIANEFRMKGLVTICINSNDAEKYPEDNFENMQKLMQEMGFEFYYLYDETQKTAKGYGAVCTPDPFLFDGNRKLVYHGRIDNGHGPNGFATSYELKAAIEQLLSGRQITVEEHPSIGCSIKWK